jgi:diguanylate cyclase (GGDEF)-like protein
VTRSQRLFQTLVGLLILSIGSVFVANQLITSQRALPVAIILPTIITGATLSGRRTTSLGITRTERQIALSPISHFLFASSILLPPLALPIVAIVVPTERRSPSSWLIRFQRLLTMNASSLVFWLAISNQSVYRDVSNQHILAFASAITTYLLVDSLIVSVVMSLVSQKPVLITAHWNLKSLLRECAEISIGCIGVIFALINPLLLLFVVAPCCLAVNHLRVNQSAQLSKRDTRTGLLNAFGLHEFVDHEFERAKRHSTELCLVVLDLDFLRDVNNNYGHQVGDLAISEVAGQISALTRAIDGTARIGGEEFVVILPDTNLDDATKVADRIRLGIEELQLPTHHGILRVTISAGVARRDQDETYSELFDRADAALYASKRLGRNRVSLADESAKTFQANQINTN